MHTIAFFRRQDWWQLVVMEVVLILWLPQYRPWGAIPSRPDRPIVGWRLIVWLYDAHSRFEGTNAGQQNLPTPTPSKFQTCQCEIRPTGSLLLSENTWMIQKRCCHGNEASRPNNLGDSLVNFPLLFEHNQTPPWSPFVWRLVKYVSGMAEVSMICIGWWCFIHAVTFFGGRGDRLALETIWRHLGMADGRKRGPGTVFEWRSYQCFLFPFYSVASVVKIHLEYSLERKRKKKLITVWCLAQGNYGSIMKESEGDFLNW